MFGSVYAFYNDYAGQRDNTKPAAQCSTPATHLTYQIYYIITTVHGQRKGRSSYGFQIVPKIGELWDFIDWSDGGVLSVLNAIFGFTLTIIIFIKFIISSCSKQVDWLLLIYYDDRHKTVTTSTIMIIITIIMTTRGLL